MKDTLRDVKEDMFPEVSTTPKRTDYPLPIAFLSLENKNTKNVLMFLPKTSPEPKKFVTSPESK